MYLNRALEHEFSFIVGLGMVLRYLRTWVRMQ